MCAQSTPTTCIGIEANSVAGESAGPGESRSQSISIVVPVFNNAGSLPSLHERLASTLDCLESSAEIIYVNDGSTDASIEVLAGILDASQDVKVIDLERNFGQSSAILAAFSLAKGDIIVTIDADLENHPEDIPALVRAIRDGADLACGVRSRRQAPLLTRRGPSWIANRLVGRALKIPLEDWGCGLNAVNAGIARRMIAQDPLPKLPKIEAALLSSSISQVPVGYSEREHGDSQYTLARLWSFATAFLSDYSATRTLRRLFGRPAARAETSSAASADSDESEARFSMPGPLALLSWSILSIFSLLVRGGRLLTGSKSTSERFRIGRVLE